MLEKVNFPDLPVFQVSGGNRGLRMKFVERLRQGLERRTITATFLKGENCGNSGGFALLSLARLFDLVIMDAGEDLPAQPIRLESYKEPGETILTLTNGFETEMEKGLSELIEKLDYLASRTPVWACILIGGKSSRMGQPKHLIEHSNNRTWLERTVEILRPVVDGLVVSGAGKLPEELKSVARLPDIPGVAGPLSGILAAGRWQPLTSWLFIACDMPHIESEAIHWLLSGRRAGCWGRVPRLPGRRHCEPLLAWYDFRAAHLFEEQQYAGSLRIGKVASHPKIDNPVIPESLCPMWRNINTPEELPGTRS